MICTVPTELKKMGVLGIRRIKIRRYNMGRSYGTEKIHRLIVPEERSIL